MRVLNLNLEQQGPGIPDGSIYIGRPHAGRRLAGSKFANPFALKDRNSDTERAEILKQYHAWLWGQVQSNAITVEDIQGLDGHDLACFCAPKHCHGMVLVKAVEWARDQAPGQDWSGQSNPIEMPRVRTLADMLKFKVR